MQWSSLTDKDRLEILIDLKNREIFKNDDIAF